MDKIKNDDLIFLNEYNKFKEMNLYNFLHKLDKLKNYNKDHSKIKNKNQLSRFLNDNYHSMTNEEKKILLNKCLTSEKINYLLLNFELKYFKPISKPMSLQEFTKETIKILNRYQCKAGGFFIEDNDWLICDNLNNNNYELKHNEVVFENTISIYDMDDSETQKYFKYLLNRLNNLCDDINVELRYIESNKDKIIWLLLWAIHDKIDPNKNIEFKCFNENGNNEPIPKISL
ncbi:Hypothetical protein KVN_LOCUS276 [uncultured virus]|nr:Hypothetical protein KVN_LOCUS276 [uncultured virus]